MCNNHKPMTEEIETTTQAELRECEDKIAQLEERYSYLRSDFDNHRRRTEQERMKALWDARAGIWRDVVGLLDNIDRAVATIRSQDAATNQQLLSGVELIQRAGAKLLEKHGLRPIGQMAHFDPEVHEALNFVTTADQDAGAIIEVFEPGYLLEGKLLRPARVSVAEKA